MALPDADAGWLQVFVMKALTYVGIGVLIYSIFWFVWKYIFQVEGLIPFIGFQFVAIFSALIGPSIVFALTNKKDDTKKK